ncbi:MAG: hypothetical protein D6694_07170 [Gammaproteobacteria bacterium]|nr:MAG: hypothetical protein D6694_07170 [Gammaproteobacteria bacterium]
MPIMADRGFPPEPVRREQNTGDLTKESMHNSCGLIASTADQATTLSLLMVAYSFAVFSSSQTEFQQDTPPSSISPYTTLKHNSN